MRQSSVRHWGAVVVLVCLACLSQAGWSLNQPGARPGEVLVRFRTGAAPRIDSAGLASGGRIDTARLQDALQFRKADALQSPERSVSLLKLEKQFGLVEGRPLNLSPAGRGAAADLWLYRFDIKAETDQILAALGKDPNVIHAEPNMLGQLCAIPSDPLYSQTRSDLQLIHTEEAWDIQTSCPSSVVVTILDSGIDATHPDLSAALDLAHCYDFTENSTTVRDDLGHGTRVAGIIAAESNGRGIAGIAHGCTLRALDIVGDDGTIAVADVVAAINFANASGSHVIAMGFTFGAHSQSLEDACRAASQAGALLVAPAGNENQGKLPVYPAWFDTVLGVGAVLDDGLSRAPWSNYNDAGTTNVDLVAPGATVFSTIPGGEYNGSFGSGTSFAAPMVAGVGALLKARNPVQLGPAIQQQILSTAVTLGAEFEPAGGGGAGLLDARAALADPIIPQISVISLKIDDSTSISAANNEDGTLDRGETVRLRFRLRCTGGDLMGVNLYLSNDDPAVTVGDNYARVSAMKMNRIVETEDHFTSLSVHADAIAHETNLTIRADAVYDPQYALSSQTIVYPITIENSKTIAAANYFTAQHWTAENTYEVKGIQNFNAGLTVDPGTVVKVDKNIDINVNGGPFNCVGNAEDPIIFKALNSPGPFSEYSDLSLQIGPRTEPIDFNYYQNIRYVSVKTGSDTSGDGSIEKPWASVNHAITSIADASWTRVYALLVAEGVYAGATVQTKAWVSMFGGFSPSDWSRDVREHPTILHGQNTRLVVNGAGAARIDGFWIIHGMAGRETDSSGIHLSSHMKVSNNFIINNYIGAGIGCMYHSAPDIWNNLIMNNSYDGINVQDSAPNIDKNIIMNNNTAIRMKGTWGWTNIRNNLIVGNKWYTVYDVYNQGFYFIVNNTIARNAGPAASSWRNCVTFGNGNQASQPDPNLLGIRYFGTARQLQFEPELYQTRVMDCFPDVPDHVLRGAIISLGQNHYYVVDNMDNQIMVAGNLINLGGLGPPPYYWTIYDFRPGYGSAYIDAGTTDSAPADDIQGRPRNVPDIGCFEYSGEKAGFWGKLNIKNTVIANIAHATFEMGGGVINQSASTNANDCIWRNNLGTAYTSVNAPQLVRDQAINNYGSGFEVGTSPMNDCESVGNTNHGILAGAVTDCDALLNRGKGIVTNSTVTRSRAHSNHNTGIQAATIDESQSTRNVGVGIVGNANLCIVQENTGVGVQGSAVSTHVSKNAGGGVAGSARNSAIVHNTGTGVSTGADVSGCQIQNNSGTAVSGAKAVTNCLISGNGSGVLNPTSVGFCYIYGNGNYGVSGGAVSHSTVVGNLGKGLVSPLSATNSWILRNGDLAVQTPQGNIDHCTIVDNKTGGVRNILKGKSVNNCNIYGNQGFQVYDDLTDAVAGYPDNCKDIRHNFWGEDAVTTFTAHPFPSENIDIFHDLFDTNVTNGWYLNYGGLGEFQTQPVAAPDNYPPAFLYHVSPNLAEPVNIGVATFTLEFSEEMWTTQPLSVTFGLAPPFTAHIVEPAPGWISPRIWRGEFAVFSDTGDGLNTIRVSNAHSKVETFWLPDDTLHQFVIEASGSLASTRGTAVGHGTRMDLSWEADLTPTALGFNVFRSPSGKNGTFRKVNALPLTGNVFSDWGLTENSTYYYIIYLVDADHNSIQIVPPFSGQTGADSAARDWQNYE